MAGAAEIGDWGFKKGRKEGRKVWVWDGDLEVLGGGRTEMGEVLEGAGLADRPNDPLSGLDTHGWNGVVYVMGYGGPKQ